jgi:hypothetical protein
MFSSAASISDYLSKFNTTYIPLQKPLPPNVRLETLKTRFDGEVLLRLAHLYAVGEDATYSQPVTVDLRDMFVGLDPVTSRGKRINYLLET